MPNRTPSNIRARALAALAALAVAPALAAPIFIPEDQPIGFLAQPRTTSLDVRNGQALAYYVDYERKSWSGNLLAFPVDHTGELDYGADLWGGGAAATIGQQHYLTGRKIVTVRDDTGARIAFLDGQLSGAQKKLMGDKAAADYVNYVRGSRADESPNGRKLRPRRYVLGDIIRSRPAYVPGTIPMLYVGANDGMLHAIRADTARETYAYIPSMLVPTLMQLAPLATAGYTHTHFVDASPRTALVTISGASKRILVGGLGAGGRGMYALDISGDSAAEPSTEAAAASKVMWEITNTRIIAASVTASTAYANLGYTYGEPIIGKANNGNDVIFMANGYMSTTGKATLLVINPADGAKVAEIDTNTGSTSSPNGLTSPTPVDVNGDGRIDYLYAGDLDGNLWKFDVFSSNPADWSKSLLFATSPTQAITIAPVVADHPRGGRIVVFGTGRVLTASDMTDASVHYMYGIWDGAPDPGTKTLLEQTVSAEEIFVDEGNGRSRRVRTMTVNAPNWANHRGWKVAMPAGERFVGDRVTLTNGRIYAHSFNPTVNLDGRTKNPVEPVYENWEYQFDYLHGGGATSPVFDLNLDGKFDSADLLPEKLVTGDPPTEGPSRPLSGRTAAAMFLAPGIVSQPVVVRTTIGAQDLYANNLDLPAPEPGDVGVSGGHFDADIYYPLGCTASIGPCSNYGVRKHVHEYDDKYGVTGVNMMNASDPNLNLSRAATSVKRGTPATKFKVLLAHQFLNPAAQVRIGATGWVKAKDYGGAAVADPAQRVPQSAQTSATALLAGEPAYDYGDVTNLIFGLPLDAFQSKDWWEGTSAQGSDRYRAGLIPTQTGCVNKISDTNFVSTPGPNGERHNGAFTVTLIRDTTPATALELVRSGDPRYGWRVKASEYRKYVLAVWTYFWHHPNGKCYGESGWVQDPPQDPTGVAPATPPPGTADPRDGDFSAIGGTTSGLFCTGDVVQTATSYNKATQKRTVIDRYSDGCKATEVTTYNGDGTVTVQVTVEKSDGTTSTTTYTLTNYLEHLPPNRYKSPATGRISWRELIRE